MRQEKVIYKKCISLGFNCAVACALERYGMRARRGPFDWIISDWKGIERCLRTEFADFLAAENCFLEKKGQFCDKEFHFYFPHELLAGEELERNYGKIRAKYARDIENFYKDIVQPTCFVRAVQNHEELLYHSKHFQEITDFLKGYHEDNQIIYLVQQSDYSDDIALPNLFVIKDYSNEDCERKSLFESNANLKDYLLRIVDKENRGGYLLFSEEKMWNAFEQYYWRYQTVVLYQKTGENLQKLLCFFKKNQVRDVAIWGAGYIGTLIHNLLKRCQVHVKYYIDAYSVSELQEDLPVHGIEPREPDVDLIVITPVWDIEKINHLISEIYGNPIGAIDVMKLLRIAADEG